MVLSAPCTWKRAPSANWPTFWMNITGLPCSAAEARAVADSLIRSEFVDHDAAGAAPANNESTEMTTKVTEKKRVLMASPPIEFLPHLARVGLKTHPGLAAKRPARGCAAPAAHRGHRQRPGLPEGHVALGPRSFRFFHHNHIPNAPLSLKRAFNSWLTAAAFSRMPSGAAEPISWGAASEIVKRHFRPPTWTGCGAVGSRT